MEQEHTLPKSGPGRPECVPDVSILLVDDFEDGLDLYREYLTYRGYRVIVARNGEEAVARARAYSPDLIMMDIRMPLMTGTDAVRILRADPSFGHVPIIALTAHAMEDERVDALAAGFDELIAKPCLPDQLVLAVERILAAARQVSGTRARELFWSKRGVVACAVHAPAPASENWNLEGWQHVPVWRHTFKLSTLQCQFCHGRPYRHHRETTKLAG
jgi:two-component system cell cycle response regulator DivK